ncbi:hypothetical protein M9H77_12519 [Catharanthus roseus]|uniref:Uncharacterized protein n=1 Tax=Catharanthus roseus TaxID=4058 RepID=A0ACC0BHK6_CATRO|nr:hypothetical protein M9H77_12519 [Catharanthus roseus]
MSSSKGGGKSNSPGIEVHETVIPSVDHVSSGVADINLDAAKDGGWEVIPKKSKSKAGPSAWKQWGQQNSNKAWGQQDAVQRLGRSGRGTGNTWSTLPTDARKPADRGNARETSNNLESAPIVKPPLKNGWNWSGRAGSTQSSEPDLPGNSTLQNPECIGTDTKSQDDDFDSDIDDEFDYDDDVLSDEFDSDSSEKSHETRKKNRWFRELFECMDGLSVDQINDAERQWHCPACKGGPGAIDWYRGFPPLITHAKTKGSNRVKLHRELAKLLEEELQRRGTSSIPAGESYGIWEGLDGMTEKEIVWPPMVVIMNTIHEKDDNDKWIGMGNQELLDYFNNYPAVRARHSYGPQGHRGMSVLIFEPSAVGYLAADRLSNHFEDHGRGRNAWERNRVPYYPGVKRQLYGYMAEKRDLDDFNKHSQGKSRLKFEIKSYLETVVKQLKQMKEDNEQLIWFKNKVAKEQRHSKAVEESYSFLSEKFRKMSEETHVVRIRTKKHHEQNKEEMDNQEQFFKDQINIIYEARNAKEDDFEKIQQEKREKVAHSQSNLSSVEDPGQRDQKIQKFIECQDKEMEEFAAERDKLIKAHEERMAEMKRRHGKEQVALENEFNAELSNLMAKYTPDK